MVRDFCVCDGTPVDLTFPLLRHLAAMAPHDDARLIGQPRLQELVHVVEKPLEGLC